MAVTARPPRIDAPAGYPTGVMATIDASRADVISERMGRLYRELFERTPEKVATHLPTDDIVLVVLEGSMTPAERRLRQNGQTTLLREHRLAVQQASADRFCEIVEAATGRRVRAFTSAHDVEADVATETFVLQA